MALLESGEMYLETIYILSKDNKNIRAIDIGEYMGYSKPSVSRAMGLLKDSGLITVEQNGAINLTDCGYNIAKTIYERHIVLTQALTQLGVDKDIASRDACKIEHYISENSFEAIKNHINKHINKHN